MCAPQDFLEPHLVHAAPVYATLPAVVQLEAALQGHGELLLLRRSHRMHRLCVPQHCAAVRSPAGGVRRAWTRCRCAAARRCVAAEDGGFCRVLLHLHHALVLGVCIEGPRHRGKVPLLTAHRPAGHAHAVTMRAVQAHTKQPCPTALKSPPAHSSA